MNAGWRLLTIGGGVLALIAVTPARMPTAVQDDEIVIEDAAGNLVTDATVYLTGNRLGGCFCSFSPSLRQSPLGNLTAGPSQVAVLSENHGLLFQPVVKWDGLTDSHHFKVTAPVDLPVKVWILAGGQTAADDFKFAQSTLRTSKTGINLTLKGITTPPLAMSQAGCNDRDTLEKKGAFDPNALNVYYAETASCGAFACESLGGLSCEDRRVNFVYSIGSQNVMVHELGHSLLGKAHWALDPVGGTNIMNDAASVRTSISTGQAIFMNNDEKSVINTLSKTAGINCTLQCPRMELDESWTTCEAPLPSPPTTTVQAVKAWFDCIECTEGELERVVTSPDHGFVTDLSRPLDGLTTSATEPVPETPPYRANRLAREQRRALTALTVLALKSDEPSRQSIRRAQENIGRYRGDVQRAVRRAFAVLQ